MKLLIVVPPFAALERPSLAAHLLQACAVEAGFGVNVLYANLWLASEIGVPAYQRILDAPLAALLGERYFARSAHAVAPFGGAVEGSLGREAGDRIEAALPDWCERVAGAIAATGFGIVGCTTSFEQTNASLALLRRVKHQRPSTITLLGGANCEGPMAEGLAAVDAAVAAVDHIFDGEGEEALISFLGSTAQGRRPQPPHHSRRAGPPDGRSGLSGVRRVFRPARSLAAGRRGDSWPDGVPWESSRGCWWGEQQHCTFCGLNGELMQFREKSAERLIGELRALAARHPRRGWR